jgi:Cu(I)/Ag(I) efflux system membrane fusion protein
LSVEQLTQPSPSESETEVAARWRTMGQLQVHSDISGVVESIDVTNGGWIETGGLALAVVDPTAIRFRAQALQSDMSRIREEQAAQIVLPQSAGFDPQEALSAKLTIGFRASSELRTIPVYAIPSSLPAWAKPGVSAFLEVFLIGADASQLAIPASAVVREGLVPVIFRRDPANSDKVIRMEADLGVGDGRWIEIRSGVRQGDEVVLDGAYQLMLASSGSAQKGGHFHADGTFHADDHEDK